MKQSIKHLLCISALSLAMVSCSTYYSEHLQGAVDGNPADEYAIATCYDDGDGGVPGGKADKAKAAEWYLKAAKKGYAKAQNNLGLLYEKGQGVPCDIDEALEWFQCAAKQGNKYGQYNFGRVMCEYLESLGGISQDEIEKHAYCLNFALKYLRLALNNGLSGAQDYINRCQKHGEHVQDFANRCGVKIQLDL